MDRLREASRRGNVSGGAQISTLRRPRTSGSFKDPADEDEVMEDLHTVRLRERPRKDSNTHSVARHKRTRNASRELYSRAEEVEETEAGEVGPSDDDDVPISPNLLPRKPTKLRFHGKVASNEVISMEIPAVPRKARTAISKRSHEGSHGDGPRHQGFTSAPLSSTAVTPFHTPLGPSLKPMKRMKHTSPKVKPSKHAKVSAPVTISQQEVEVAEALFDLARMVSNLGSPGGIEEKMEAKTENSELKGTARLSSPEGTPLRRQDSVSTPQTSHSAASSPVRGPLPVTSSHLSSTDGPTKRISLLKLRVDDGAISQPKDETIGRLSDFKGVVDSCTGQSVGSNAPADIKVNASIKTGQGSHQKAALSSSVLPLPSQSSVVADSNALVAEAKSSLSPKKLADNITGLEHGLKSDASLVTEFSEQKQHGIGHSPQDARDTSAMVKDKALKSTHAYKYEIDLMASPNASASGASEKTGNSVDSGLVSSKQKQDKVTTQTFMDMVSVTEEKTSRGNDKEARMSFMPEEEHVKTGVLKEKEREKRFVEVSKQEASDSHQSSKPDLISQHPGSGSGWPGSLSHMGYYPAAAAAAAAAAAVAAAWPATGSVMGPVSMEEKDHSGLLVAPLTFPGARPLCKRCAMHVYIAHFIDTQQQMQRHPIWAAAFGNNASGSLYSMKSYNANAPPLPPNVLFGGGLTGLTGLTVNNYPANKGPSSESSPQNDKGSAPADKEMSTVRDGDGSGGQGASQSSQPGMKDQTTPFQVGLGSMLGYSPVAHGNVSKETGGSNAPSKGVSGGESTTVVSHMELAGASTGAASNSQPVNTAAAQVQYLQAIIQQAGFPFSFAPGHLMPPTQGHLTQQQTAPFFNNPFYNAPFMHPQQSPATSKATPKASSLQGQSTSMHRDTRVSPSVLQLSPLQQHQQQQQQQQEQQQQQKQQQQFSSASSSHSHQRAASQHLQHLGDMEMNFGAETISSAESKYPGYPKMHSQEVSNLHASNMTTSSSALNSAGMSVLPAQVALAARQTTNMNLPQSGHAQQQSPNTTPYHYPSGGKTIDFQSTQTSSGMHIGGLSKNMVGPGPLGLASVAAVMAPQGHAVLQNISDAQLSHAQAYQESYSKQTSSMSLDGARASCGIGIGDDKRLVGKQGGPIKMDKESEGSVQGSSGYKSGLSSATISGISFNFTNSPVGSSGSRQAAPISAGSVPSLGVGRANPNITVTAPESTTLSRTPSPSLLFHVSSVTPNQGLRQGQTGGQYSSQPKPASRIQVGTTNVSTAPSSLLPGSYAGAPTAKQQSYPSKNHQAPMSSMQSRFPPSTSGSSSASVSPSAAVSKATGSAPVKNISGAKGSINSSQKQNLATPGKKPDAVLTYLPGQLMGPSSVTVNMGQSQPQQHQSQHQQMQHVMRQQQQQQQQQQQWPQQQKQVHQEHPQHAPQSMHQQFHVTGVPPAVSLQYHQALGSNQAVQVGVHKQSASPQQLKQHPYLDQHTYQPQQQQSQLAQSPQSARMSMQPQQQHSAQQNIVSVTNRSVQQLSELQANKQQAASAHHQSMSLASFGALSSAAPHTPASFSIGCGSGGRPGSSDGNISQVSNSKGTNSMKPPGSAPNVQRSSTSGLGISQYHGVGAKGADAKLPSQSSGNISYLPYLQSATFSGGAAPGGKIIGASGIHAQSGASMISMRDVSAGAGHENSTSLYENDRSSPASKAAVMSGYSVCATTAVKSSVSQPIVSCMAPLTPGLSSQTCTVTSATMTADSVSTTG